ncbi:MAG: hypothetical protein V7754_13715 [Halioglobus sp.]
MPHLPKILSQFFVVLCLIFTTSLAHSQQISKSSYENQTEEYVAITAIGKAFSTKWKVEVDFGQAFEWSVKNKDLLRDNKGKVVSFASPIDALNFLNSQGWSLVNASADADYFYAIMRRAK